MPKAQGETKGRKSRSATARVMEEKLTSIGEAKEPALRAGKGISVVALAHLWIDKETSALEGRRAQMFIDLIASSKAEDVDNALRGPTKDERKAAKAEDRPAEPPFVTEAVREGMLKSSAQARLSQMRAVRAAYDEGIIDRSKVPGWNALVKLAVERAEARKVAKESLRQSNAYNKVLSEITTDLINEKMTPEEKKAARLKALEMADSKMMEKTVETELEKQEKAKVALVQKITDDGADYALDILNRLALACGYKLEKMTKKEIKEAHITVVASQVVDEVEHTTH
jgi:hypothetical protein